MAAELKLTVNVVCPPPASAPLFGEAVSQDAALLTLQLSEADPMLVNENFCLVTLNAPPTGPLEVKPLVGETANGGKTCNVNW